MITTTAVETRASTSLLKKFLHIEYPKKVKDARVIVFFDNENDNEYEHAPDKIQKQLMNNKDFREFYNLTASI